MSHTCYVGRNVYVAVMYSETKNMYVTLILSLRSLLKLKVSANAFCLFTHLYVF
jgi:hypothetical protein